MDFNTAARSILGYEVNGSLLSLNYDALQGILFALIRKLQDFGAKIERIEYELENKPNKTEFHAIRENLRLVPSQGEIQELLKNINDKADKSELELAFDLFQEFKDRQSKLESSVKLKASKQDLDVVSGQIAYLQESYPLMH